MLLVSNIDRLKPDDRLDTLTERLRAARMATPAIVADVITHACERFPERPTAAVSALNRLLRAEAWVDAAVALLALEAPDWTLRRLLYEDGEWLCSLTQQPQLPVELADAIESHHENAALAILMALVETRRMASTPEAAPHAARSPQGQSGVFMCCENFA